MSLERLDQIKPFLVMDVLEKADEMERAGENIIHFEIGEPDFDTPKKIREAAIQSLERSETHYTHSLGIYPLREAVSRWYRNKYRVDIDPEQVIITMGTSPGLLLALSVLVSTNDEVILSNPGYACYESFIRYLQAKPKPVPVVEDNGFQLSIETIRHSITPKTKAILINSPSNPTGVILSTENMIELSNLGIPVISDEIYHGLVYEGRAHSILEFTTDAFVLNGFSKYFAMTGWRLGYIIAPQKYVRTIQKLQQNYFISAANFVQHAGLSALTEDHPEIAEMVAAYKERRSVMIELIRSIGLTINSNPSGAYYIFANAKKFTSDSLSFSMELLEKAKVAVAPGIDFGSNGEGYLRFSYATSIEDIREGIDRLEQYLIRR